MRSAVCPSTARLEEFHLGLLDEANLDQVAEHIEGCPECEQAIRQLDRSIDPLIGAIRNYAQSTRAQHLDRTLKDRAASPDLSFLRPPEAPDELGRFLHYRVLRLIGTGGMGLVYEAEDVALGRRVALKILRPELSIDPQRLQRFLREARTLASIKHANVVAVYQAGQDGGTLYLAMELLTGESLDDWLNKPLRPGPSDLLRLAREITSGLSIVHQHGLIHRDFKPSNIWLEGAEQRVRILDFGLARAVDDDANLTKPGMIMGTPSFMSPEQASGARVDLRADLFSLGCVLYYLCSGTKPFRGENTLAALSALAVHTPEPPHQLNPALPVALSELIMELLAKSPAARPASAEAVLERLREIDPATDVPMWITRQRPTSSTLNCADDEEAQVKAGSTPIRQRSPVLTGALAVACGAGLLVALMLMLRIPPRDARDDEAVSPPGLLARTFTSSVGMELIRVNAGTFLMGGGGGKQGERPVFVSHDFYLGKFEVTQEQWEKVMGENPSHFSRAGRSKDMVADLTDADLKRFPVEHITWFEAQAFLEKLNRLDPHEGWQYRLPTEIEWEYACRGGPAADASVSGFDFYLEHPTNLLLEKNANIRSPDTPERPTPVGSYPPNRLGFCDMHGNVDEWCADTVDTERTRRIIRGGHFYGAHDRCRAAHQSFADPKLRASIGLRVALAPVQAPAGHYTNLVGMEFVPVPRGKFLIGGTSGQPGQDQVTIADDFFLAATEVTQQQWQEVMGANPSFFSRRGEGHEQVKNISEDDLARFPVEQVSWQDAQTFIARLNEKDRQRLWEYRLPTQMEWEYACRGGAPASPIESRADFYFDKPLTELSGRQANFKCNHGLLRTCRVGGYLPNRLGLYNMHGNVSEWCLDEVRGDKPDWTRVFRGGSWNMGSQNCRAGSVHQRPPDYQHANVGPTCSPCCLSKLHFKANFITFRRLKSGISPSVLIFRRF
ncbi:MAG: bifunctional serine/threonine-protein kinase/formylglycine-generating enzyme family protein, partial [Gemmataceae bacterium]